MVAKVKWHPGELVPRVGFIVTNLSRSAERVVAFYNQRGKAEQYIKEGKNAIKWTRLSCRKFQTGCRHAIDICRSEEPMLSQLGFEHDVACHRWEELFEDQASAIVSAQVPEARPVPEPVPAPKPVSEPALAAEGEPMAPAAEEAPMAPEVLANELARLRRNNRIAIVVSIIALLALPFSCAL